MPNVQVVEKIALMPRVRDAMVVFGLSPRQVCCPEFDLLAALPETLPLVAGKAWFELTCLSEGCRVAYPGLYLVVGYEWLAR